MPGIANPFAASPYLGIATIDNIHFPIGVMKYSNILFNANA